MVILALERCTINRFPMGTKTQNLKTHFVDEFGAVSRNAALAVPSGRPSEH